MPSFSNSKKRLIRIGIDGGDFVSFGKVDSGIKRIVDSFLREIGKLKSEDYIFNYYYFGKSELKKKVANINFIRLPEKFFASIFLPIQFIKDRNSLFLGFSGYLPSLISLINTKRVVFLYDLGFIKYPQFYSNPKKLKNNLTRVMKLADKIITLSDYSKKQITKYFSADEKKIVRLYPGLDHFAGKNLINQLIKFKYFLYVGVIKPIKNIEGLFKRFYQFLQLSPEKKYYLILIGEKEEEYFNSLLTNGDYKKIKRKVIFLNNISDDELVNYYLKATALLNFSHEEGFCFPVLEALSFGKKAIVNDLPIYHEFEDKFDNLLVGKNEREIVQLMVGEAERVNRYDRNKRPKEGVIFKWRDFTEKLLEIITGVISNPVE